MCDTFGENLHPLRLSKEVSLRHALDASSVVLSLAGAVILLSIDGGAAAFGTIVTQLSGAVSCGRRRSIG